MSGYILFLAVVLSIYSGFHYYAFLKFKYAFLPNTGISIAILLFFGMMVFTPVLVRLLERSGYDLSTRILAYIALTWMGVLFIFVSTAFFFDIYRLILFLFQWAANLDLSRIRLTPRHIFLISLFLTISISVYGSFEATNIRSEYVDIRTSKLPKGVDRFRIAQISDVHLGLIVGEKRLERILSKVASASPDILVSTGDLVDGQMSNRKELAALLRNVPVKYGRFAVSGNHEYYAGINKTLAFTRQAGFRVLRNESVNMADIITIAGIDDDTGHSDNFKHALLEKNVLSKVDPHKFVLFLKHRPVVENDSLGLFDLQLSGHTHKGQIFPFSILTALSFAANSGLLELDKGAHLYVNRGSGTWGPPIRFLSPPEVTIIDLVRE